MGKAAKLGVPLPDTSGDGRYDILDDYVDDLLGIQSKDRPADWKRPAVEETEKSLPNAPHIIYSNGTRGPPAQAAPPTMQAMLSGHDASGNAAAPAPANPYLNGVIGGWASIDAAPKGQDPTINGVSSRTADGTGPAPKRKVKP